MRIDGKIAVLAAVASIAAGAAPSALADTEGFVFGLAPHSNHIGTRDRPPDPPTGSVFVNEDGGGLSLFLGWGITPAFSLRLNVAGAGHETSDPDVEVAYGGVTLESAYLFRDGRAVRPFLLGGLGAFVVSSRRDQFDFQTTGPGIVFGGGAYWFLGETFALDLGARTDFINWDLQTATVTLPDGSKVTGETPIREEGSAVKVLLGASFWF